MEVGQRLYERTAEDFRISWSIYHEFDRLVFQPEKEGFSDFLMEWQRRLLESQNHGHVYQDDVLAYKLLSSANVGEEVQDTVFQALQDRKMPDVEDLLLQTMACLTKVMEHDLSLEDVNEEDMNAEGYIQDEPSDYIDEVATSDTESKNEHGEDLDKSESKFVLIEPFDMSNQFKCVECSMRLKSRYLQELHQHRIHELPLVCTECPESFDNNREFNAHLRKIHNMRKKSSFKTDAVCPQCGKTFSTRKGLTDHRRYHKEKYSCGKCAAKFEKKAHLLDHQKEGPCTDPSALPKEYVCEVCNKVFDKGFVYNKHVNTAHGNRYPCTLCSTRFAARRSLLDHLQDSHPGQYTLLKCDICGKDFFSEDDLNSHNKVVHNKKFACDHCPKMFAKNCELQKHLRGHEKREAKKEEKKPTRFQCEHCGKEILGSRLYHMKTHFSFRCIPCGKERFETQEQLDDHVRKHKSYRCELCNLTFTKQYLLKRHMELPIHSAAPNYECEICGKTMYTKEQYYTHKIAHKSREYNCTFENCDKSFRQPGMLKRHIARHSGEKKWMCPEPGCEKRFTTKSSLSYHMVTHSNVKKFKCNQCEKAFFFKDKLMRHLRVHTEEKPYPCDVCTKSYAQRKDLKIHKKKCFEKNSEERVESLGEITTLVDAAIAIGVKTTVTI